MRRVHLILSLSLCNFVYGLYAINAPVGVVSRTGDQSVVLHWERNTEPNLAGYRVYRSSNSNGPFTLQNTTLLNVPGFCDLAVINGQTNYYQVKAVTGSLEESPPSVTLGLAPNLFASDDDFLEYIQQVHFDYFWYLANPTNGLVPDRSPSASYCSIAAVGFGLSGIGIGIDHGWITRTQGIPRVLATLNTFLQGPQGTNTFGTIGYKGWFYHFIDMNNATRAPNSELSSIDTALLLGGMLHCKQYFDRADPDEAAIRSKVDAIFNRIDWNWMARGTNALAMGWFPPGTFISANWIGYNEAMLLYCLGLGAATNPLPASAWSRWTSGYTWATNYGQAFVPFPPLFGHQYSHCWIDFRHVADAYMHGKNTTYFENSRRATIAQRAYCIANPLNRVGYSSNVWGLTACDGPNGYSAHGAPPAENDDGTIAPTAAGGSMCFTPEYSLPTLRHFYKQFRPRIWTAFGYRDAFNLGAQWYGSDTLGIDQGPILIMIENYRNQRVWRLFMRNPEVQRGLERAGFTPLAFMTPTLETAPAQNTVSLAWPATPGKTYQVEYSTDLESWQASPTGQLIASGASVSWIDAGPPGTFATPFSVPQRFYRVFQFGFP